MEVVLFKSILNYIKPIVAPLFFRIHGKNMGQRMEISFWKNLIGNKKHKYKEEFMARINKNREVRGYHREILDQIYKEDLRILDVGSGPITKIGYYYNDQKLNITACDPNAKAYNELLERSQLESPVKTIFAEGEKLSTTLTGKFDWINCENALDHMEDPDKALQEMKKLLAPQGMISLFHEINEGIHRAYTGYHKWNICSDNRRSFSIWNPLHKYTYNEYCYELAVFSEIRNKSYLLIILKNP